MEVLRAHKTGEAEGSSDERNLYTPGITGNAVVYTSPLLRCVQSAELLFPDLPKTVVPDFCECAFGQFEYRNYQELDGNPDYQRYIDSGGECGFPGGEDRRTFQDRTVRAFLALPEIRGSRIADTVVLVAHGGTIMALLDEFSSPHADYFNWQVKNGEGFRCVWDSVKKKLVHPSSIHPG